MKWLMFSIMLFASITTASAEGRGETEDSVGVHDLPQETFYLRNIIRRQKVWNSLIPTQIILQNAGNMGLISAGIGWDYGRHNQWETHLLVGFLPKYSSRRAKVTMTLKETFLPWRVDINESWMFEPLSCGIYLNTVFGHEFWGRQPDRYPKDYYPLLTTNMRVNVFLGERITFDIPKNKRKFVKSISAFYEVSTCDLYIRAKFLDKKVSLWDIIGLSLGVKLQIQ